MKKYLLLILIALPATLALFQPGFFPSHDGEWMVIRFSAFHHSLVEGQFPVRWSARLNHGYGYPVLNFLYPLPFYLAEIFFLFTQSFTLSIKWVFIASLLLSALTSFVWLKRHFSPLAALAGSVLYLYTPYRFVDAYVRGSVAESLAFVFVPLLFLSVDLIPKKRQLALSLGALAVAGTILSHNVFSLFVVLSLVYGFITLPPKMWPQLMLLILFGLGLSAYFWVPAISELSLVRAADLIVADPKAHLLNLSHLVIPSWGFGPADPKRPDSLSFQVGVVNLLVVVIAVLKFKGLKAKPRPVTFFLLLFVAAVFLMHTLSRPLWQVIPGIAVIQFPWRLLSVTTLATSFLAAWAVNHNRWRLAGIALITLSVILTFPYAKTETQFSKSDSFYATNEDTTTVKQEYLPLWVKVPPRARTGDRVTFLSGRGVVADLKETNRIISFRLEASENAKVQIAQIYYPGWQATVNGQVVQLDYGDTGLMSVSLGQGVSFVSFRFGETRLRSLANWLSLTTLLGILSYWFCFYCQTPGTKTSTKKRTRKRI
ncbi:MAG: hypothetical protein HYS86_04615 [Candidatus Chisholmbacteria bacterium]|nr:hypothetical protein [Candidatus Chisholmbacteria bacterium]